MLPIPHLLLFVPVIVLVSLVTISFAINGLAGFIARPRKPATPPAPVHSAQILAFKPRKTPLPSGLGVAVRRAMPQ